jgi:hypothetical protein
MDESAALSELSNGDLDGWLRTLPAEVSETFDMTGPDGRSEGAATIIRMGKAIIRQTGPGRIDLHVHETVEEACTCFVSASRIYRGGDLPRGDIMAMLQAALTGNAQAAAQQVALPPRDGTGMYL